MTRRRRVYGVVLAVIVIMLSVKAGYFIWRIWNPVPIKIDKPVRPNDLRLDRI